MPLVIKQQNCIKMVLKIWPKPAESQKVQSYRKNILPCVTLRVLQMYFLIEKFGRSGDLASILLQTL